MARMEDTEVQYSVGDLDGVRLIRTMFPKTLAPSTMAEGYAKYLALWEVDTPTVVLVDVSRLDGLPPAGRGAIAVLLRRIGIIPSFITSAWLCGRNPVASVFEGLLREAGRDVRAIFEREEDAIAYLRERIAEWRARQ
jgi:hypothetical protein